MRITKAKCEEIALRTLKSKYERIAFAQVGLLPLRTLAQDGLTKAIRSHVDSKFTHNELALSG